MIKLLEIISASPDQFEFEYSETGNQFEFGLRDISEQEFAAESIAILNNKDLYIESFGTNPKYRKQGLGSKLINEIINFAKARKIIKITLDVRSGNKSAINLYKKFGFNPINKRRGDTLDKMELILGMNEIKSIPNITPDIAHELHNKLMDRDMESSDKIYDLDLRYGYEDFLENNTQPGRGYSFFEYLKDKGTINQFYSELNKI